MRSIRFACAVMLLLSTAHPAVHAADVVNGWSPVGVITKVHSVYSYTYFRLGSTSLCRGQDRVPALREQRVVGFRDLRVTGVAWAARGLV